MKRMIFYQFTAVFKFLFTRRNVIWLNLLRGVFKYGFQLLTVYQKLAVFGHRSVISHF
jgi:hypothetical protein